MPERDEARPVKLFGYSERGMFNALCDDITYSDEPLSVLGSLLSLIQFPNAEAAPDWSSLVSATVIVEQSFSDFGDLDLLILLDHAEGKKQAVLVEGKVHTDTSSPKSLSTRWREFQEYLAGNKEKKENLFVQLYRKMRLMRQLSEPANTLSGDAVANQYRLGANQVVKRAADLLAKYRANPWYVALVPDSQGESARFFGTLPDFSPDSGRLPDWNSRRIGFVTWEQVQAMSRQAPSLWRRTESSFEWNKGQIYREAIAPPPNQAGSVVAKRLYRLYDDLVMAVVSRTSNTNCTVVPVDCDGAYFPTPITVAKGLLQDAEQVSVVGDLQPRLREVYFWQPPQGVITQPPNKPPVPTLPCQVRVLDPGWKESRVQRVDEVGQTVGDDFYVFTHHLRRR